MNIKIFSTKKEASFFVSEIITNAVKSNSKITLGLATGSSPIETYHEIIKTSIKDKVDFSEVTTFNLDEYVNLNLKFKSESYLEFMDKNLFSQININKNNTHFPSNYSSEYEVGTLFQNYDDKIIAAGGIDIQILGIGQNGHIGFNEPGSKIDSITRCVQLVESTINANSRFFPSINDVPKKAISMGLKSIIKSSKRIILIAFGEEKRAAIEKLIHASEFDKNWPCTSLYDFDNLLIVTDIDLK